MNAKVENINEFYKVGGSLSPNSPSYVERLADKELLKLTSAGQLCYVLTTRQIGKTSLMYRTTKLLNDQGIQTANIDLSGIGSASIELWYASLIDELARDFGLPTNAGNWWEDNSFLSCARRFNKFVTEVVLSEVQDQIVIFIDEVEYILNFDFSDDFFASIRALYNRRAQDPELNRLTFAILGTTSPAELIKDRTRTPFNIGHEISLDDFKREDAKIFQERMVLRFPELGHSIFDRIYYYTNGHPYLIQKLCWEVERSDGTIWSNQEIDRLVEKTFLLDKSHGETSVQYARDKILTNPRKNELLKLYKRIYNGKNVYNDNKSTDQMQLKLSGLVKVEDDKLQVRNEIYRRAFNSGWIREHLAVNWRPWVMGFFAILIILLVATILWDNYWVPTQASDAELDFFHAESAPTKTAAILRLFELNPLIANSSPYENAARELFFGISSYELQEEILESSNFIDSPKSLSLLVRKLYVALADLDGTFDSNSLLVRMSSTLSQFDNPILEDLRSEIDSWLLARSAFQLNNISGALSHYNDAIRINSNNPATLFERARSRASLEEYELALSDLDRVIAITLRETGPEIEEGAPESSTSTISATKQPGGPTPLPTSDGGECPDLIPPFNGDCATPSPISQPGVIRPQFGTREERISAVRQLLESTPGLVQALSTADTQEFSNLRNRGLAPTATPLAQPIFVADLVSPQYLQNYTNSSDCDWLGLAGEVFDLNGNPVARGNYRVHVWDSGIDSRVTVGDSPAYGPSGYEQFLSDAPRVQEHNVQLETANGTAVSQVYRIQTRASCNQNLVYFGFTQNQ